MSDDCKKGECNHGPHSFNTVFGDGLMFAKDAKFQLGVINISPVIKRKFCPKQVQVAMMEHLCLRGADVDAVTENGKLDLVVTTQEATTPDGEFCPSPDGTERRHGVGRIVLITQIHDAGLLGVVSNRTKICTGEEDDVANRVMQEMGVDKHAKGSVTPEMATKLSARIEELMKPVLEELEKPKRF